MLIVRFMQKSVAHPRFARVRREAPQVMEVLAANPILDGMLPTGETLPYDPQAWQADPDASLVELLPPVTPSKIVAIGSNYRNHAKEMGKPVPDEPILFMKPPSALLAPGRPIVRPPGYERVDYEGELAVVIGRRLHRTPPESVAAGIFGYTALNDVTVRDLQKKDGQFTRAKGFDSFCPVGPAIATDIDPLRFRLRTRKNGVQQQDTAGDELVFSVVQLVSFISHVMTLEPGDVITTGTPSGVGPVQPGDVVAITVDGVGTLENPVVGEPA
jgi:2-keto-4-pentenoate hydratase/2-oxohepta-3-ene-1,7-dioic acid hydratase in catechol pathway